MNSSLLKDIIKLLTLAFGIIIIGMTYYNKTAAFHLPKNNYTKSKEKKAYKKAQSAKRKMLDQSYEDMMCLGDDHMAVNEYYEASKRYFDAKSIYPERFEPRIALCRSLIKLAKNTDYFLPSTQKEIYYAFNYAHKTTDERLLDELCQMDKDVITIFETAKSRFKYWDELMTLEDY